MGLRMIYGGMKASPVTRSSIDPTTQPNQVRKMKKLFLTLLILVPTLSSALSAEVVAPFAYPQDENTVWFKSLLESKKSQTLTDSEKNELMIRSRSSNINIWLGLTQEDPHARSILLDVLIEDICNHNYEYIKTLLYRTLPEEYSETDRMKMARLISEFSAENFRRSSGIEPLMLAGYMGIPEAHELAKKWLPPLGKIQLSRLEWAAIVVCTRFGDQDRVEQIIEITETYNQRKRPIIFVVPYDNYLFLTKSKDVFEYLLEILGQENIRLSEGHFWGTAGKAKLALQWMVVESDETFENLIQGFFPNMERKEELLKWWKTEPSITFR